MNNLSTDKYEKKLWILTLVYLVVILVVGTIFQFIGDTTSIRHYPSWWEEAMNTVKIFLVILFSLFGFVVVRRGRKIMKQQEKKPKPEEPRKLTKEEEDKKYGL